MADEITEATEPLRLLGLILEELRISNAICRRALALTESSVAMSIKRIEEIRQRETKDDLRIEARERMGEAFAAMSMAMDSLRKIMPPEVSTA